MLSRDPLQGIARVDDELGVVGDPLVPPTGEGPLSGQTVAA